MRTFSTIGGNGGTFKAWHDTGEAFEHEPSEEVSSGDHAGYAAVARVDWAEHLAFWNAGRAVDQQYTVPHDYIDILDVGGTMGDGEAFEAESDWRVDMKAEYRCNYSHLFADGADSSAVFNIETLDEEFRVKFDAAKPWIFEHDAPSSADCHFVQTDFATEEEACAAQRAYREGLGFDPMTGAPRR